MQAHKRQPWRRMMIGGKILTFKKSLAGSLVPYSSIEETDAERRVERILTPLMDVLYFGITHHLIGGVFNMLGYE